MSLLVREKIERRPSPELARVRAALQVAREDGVEVFVPAAVLAELYRGGGQDAAVDACLNRNTGIVAVDTDKALARRVGNLLARSGRGSEDHVDATVVAVAAVAGGGTCLTGDLGDLEAIAGGTVGVTIKAL